MNIWAGLQYAHENECVWDDYVYTNNAKNGYLSCFHFHCHENGCPWTGETCISAAKTGN